MNAMNYKNSLHLLLLLPLTVFTLAAAPAALTVRVDQPGHAIDRRVFGSAETGQPVERIV